MKIITRKTPIAAALVGGLLFLGACDVDRDGEFDDNEFEQSVEDAGAEVADAAEEAGENIEAFFAEWDENADRAFDEEEFERWWSDANPFEEWDEDGDDRLNRTEWDGVLHVDLDTVDADGDGVVTRREMREGLFEVLDENDDGRIDRDEWRRAEV